MGLELFNTFILLLLVAAALVALKVRDLITASVVFGIYSFLMCLLWAVMGASKLGRLAVTANSDCAQCKRALYHGAVESVCTNTGREVLFRETVRPTDCEPLSARTD